LVNENSSYIQNQEEKAQNVELSFELSQTLNKCISH